MADSVISGVVGIGSKSWALVAGGATFLVALAWNEALSTEIKTHKLKYGHFIYAVSVTIILAVLLVLWGQQ